MTRALVGNFQLLRVISHPRLLYANDIPLALRGVIGPVALVPGNRQPHEHGLEGKRESNHPPSATAGLSWREHTTDAFGRLYRVGGDEGLTRRHPFQ